MRDTSGEHYPHRAVDGRGTTIRFASATLDTTSIRFSTFFSMTWNNGEGVVVSIKQAWWMRWQKF